MKKILVLAWVSLLLGGCGLFRAEVGLPPTEASGGAIRILVIPLLESVNWCAGMPCRLTSPVSNNVQYYEAPSTYYDAGPRSYWVPNWPQPGVVRVEPLPRFRPGRSFRPR